MVTVCFAELVDDEGIVAGAGCGREFEREARVVDLVDLDALDFGQLLHAALHLHGLGGLVAEALDELLGVGNLLLLVLVGAHLLLDSLLA